MKRSVILLSLLVLASLACALTAPFARATATPSADAAAVAAMVTQTLAALQTAQHAPPASETPAPSTIQPVTPAPGEVQSPQPEATRPLLKRPGELIVAYTLAGDIFLWRSDGSSEQITRHGLARDVRVAPTGAWVAYVRQVDGQHQEIWAVSPDGSTDKPLVTTGDLTPPADSIALLPDQMEWSASGETLYYTTVISYAGPGQPASNDLRSVEVTSAQKKILLPGGSGGGRFYFAPNGQLVLLVRGNGFAIARPDGSELRELFSYPAVMTYSEWTYLPDPVWSSDSANFRVIIPPEDSLGQPDDATIVWEIPVNGSAARQVGAFVASPAWQTRPLLSPNGVLLVYQAPKPGSGGSVDELHLANADLTVDRVLRSGDMRLENWSPDSKLFVLWVAERRELQAGSVSGNFFAWPVGIKPIKLEWVDAARFLVVSGTYEAPELYLGNRDGTYTRIVTSEAPDLNFDFQP